MPATLPPPGESGGRQPLELGAVIEKIKRGGSAALNQKEKMFVHEIFRRASDNSPQFKRARDDISVAHLEYCFRMNQ